MTSTNITETQIELPPGCTTDIHICGQCRSHFTSIDSFIDHKQSGCSLPSNPSDVAVPSSAHGETTAAKQGKRRPHGSKEVPSKTTAPKEHRASEPSQSGHQQHDQNNVKLIGDAGSFSSVRGLSPQGKARGKNVPHQASQQSTPLQASTPVTEKRYKCSHEGCEFTTKHLKDMQRHYRIHTGEKPYECTYCYKRFARQDKLKIHHRIHSGDKPFQCNQCSYCCVDGGSLKKHMRIHNDERPFKCQICEYRSRNSSQLIVHLRTHTGDTPFHCQLCDSKFKINSDLTRHMRTHSGEKPYKCPSCDYKSSLKSNLSQHFRSNHGNEKKYQCEECGFACCTKRQMKQHSHSHATTKPIKCLECTFQCYNKVVFKRHERKHSDERPYKCKYCDFDSKYPGHVPAHIKKRHPETIKKRPNRKGKKDKSKIPPTSSGPDGTLQVVSRKPFQCNVCEASFMRQDSLLSHKRQHERLNRATSREIMDRESTAYAIYQLQYSGGVAPETESNPYGGSDKQADVLNTLLSAIDMETTDQSDGVTLRVQQQPTQHSTEMVPPATETDATTSQRRKSDILEVTQFPTNASTEVEVTSDDPPRDGNSKIDKAKKSVLIVHSNANIHPNAESVTFELHDHDEQLVLAEVQPSSPQMTSHNQTPGDGMHSSTRTSVNQTMAGDHSYPEVTQRNSATYIQILEPQSISHTGVPGRSPAQNNLNPQGVQASVNTTLSQQVRDYHLPSQFITQHASGTVLPRKQHGSIQLVMPEPVSQTDTTPGISSTGQPIAMATPSTILIHQQTKKSVTAPVTCTMQSSNPTQQSQMQSQSRIRHQQTLLVQPDQQQISQLLTFTLSQQRQLQQQQQQQDNSSPQQTGTTLQQLTFPQPTATVSSVSSSAVVATTSAVQQQQEPLQVQLTQSSPAVASGSISNQGQPSSM